MFSNGASNIPPNNYYTPPNNYYTPPNNYYTPPNNYYTSQVAISITIPSTIISIGDNAFCSSLLFSQVVLTRGLKIIGYYMFQSDLSMTIVSIPSTITSIGFNN